MISHLRFLLALFTILSCTTIASWAVQGTHGGVVFEKTCVFEGETHFWADFNAAKAAGAGEKLFWGTWNDYPKVTQGGRSYAQVGDRLYTHHAVDRMQTSGLGAPAGAGSPGRSISPNFIEDVIQTGNQRAVTVDGVPRQVFTSGSVEVVTEQGGRIVITVNPFKN